MSHKLDLLISKRHSALQAGFNVVKVRKLFLSLRDCRHYTKYLTNGHYRIIKTFAKVYTERSS